MLSDISSLIDQIPKPTGPLEPARLDVVESEYDENESKTRILYKADPQIYDSGNLLTIICQRNEDCPDATENHLLDLHPIERDYEVLDILDEFLPNVSQFYPTATRFTLKTVEGKLTADITEDVDEIIPYLPIPAHLSHIPTVPIDELRKVRGLVGYVHLVKWKNQDFAFKKASEFLEGMIQELTILDKLRDSPYIIDLKAIVTNNQGLIRGFLMPYMHPGDLTNVFLEARKSQGRTEDDKCELIFDWSVKLSWACQVTQGVVDLHNIAAYNGDLKPSNIVLSPSGQAILIDFLPMGISDAFAAPELLAKYNDHTEHSPMESFLTAGADIYSLGLVLYAIVQERTDGILQPLEWDHDMVPTWFMSIVQRCLIPNVADRPSATEVLALLQRGNS